MIITVVKRDSVTSLKQKYLMWPGIMWRGPPDPMVVYHVMLELPQWRPRLGARLVLADIDGCEGLRATE